MSHKPAGGPKSKNVTHPRVRTGTGSHSTRPAGVNMLGAMQGNKVTGVKGTTGYTGERLHNPARNFQPTKFGNEIAASTTCGPGGSRKIYGSGSQQTYGSINPGSPRPNTQRDALEGE